MSLTARHDSDFMSPKANIKPIILIVFRLYHFSFWQLTVLSSNLEQRGAPFGGAGAKHQELGLLAQTHHAHRLHH